jgi:hypothetical protein
MENSSDFLPSKVSFKHNNYRKISAEGEVDPFTSSAMNIALTIKLASSLDIEMI